MHLTSADQAGTSGSSPLVRTRRGWGGSVRLDGLGLGSSCGLSFGLSPARDRLKQIVATGLESDGYKQIRAVSLTYRVGTRRRCRWQCPAASAVDGAEVPGVPWIHRGHRRKARVAVIQPVSSSFPPVAQKGGGGLLPKLHPWPWRRGLIRVPRRGRGRQGRFK